MTFRNISFLIAVIVVVAAASKLLSRWYGIDQAIVALIGGGLALISMFALHSIQRSRALPQCETGRCGTSDYKWLGRAVDAGVSDFGGLLECKCGKHYAFYEDKFLSVGQDKRLKTYKVKKGSRWV